jgi:hypothetical protein
MSLIKAELGLILKALDALDLQVSLNDKGASPAPGTFRAASRLDEVFQRLDMVSQMARAVPDVLSDTRARAFSDGLSRQVVSPLIEQLTEHARGRLAAVTAATSKTPGLRRRRRK